MIKERALAYIEDSLTLKSSAAKSPTKILFFIESLKRSGSY